MSGPHRAVAASLNAGFALALLATACAGGEHGAGEDSFGSVSTSGDAGRPRRTSFVGGRSSTSGGGGNPIVPVDAGASDPPSCGLPDRPIDVIFVIDTSGSMTQEIVAIQQNINQNFAHILDREGVDYRVILIGTHGISDDLTLRICISQPLSGGDCAPVPSQPHNSERFRHFSAPVFSLDSFCQILDTFSAPDEFGLAPTGWSGWLRSEALKVFVEVTDDSAGCSSVSTGALFSMAEDPQTVAESFDTALRQLSPDQFEAEGVRNYKWYSIVGLWRSAPPTEELVFETCGSAPTPGLAYQALSVITESMRYPVCEGTSFAAAFEAIADEVVDEALPCQ